jgi:hypothetical protein
MVKNGSFDHKKRKITIFPASRDQQGSGWTASGMFMNRGFMLQLPGLITKRIGHGHPNQMFPTAGKEF